MTDSIFYRILCSNDQDENIKKAKELLRRIQKRDLYRFCGEINSKVVNGSGLNEISQEIADKLKVNENDIFIRKSTFSFGNGIKNPLEKMKFCNKDGQETKPRVTELISLLPRNFEESYIRVFYKAPEKFETAKERFNTWLAEIKMKKDVSTQTDS